MRRSDPNFYKSLASFFDECIKAFPDKQHQEFDNLIEEQKGILLAQIIEELHKNLETSPQKTKIEANIKEIIKMLYPSYSGLHPPAGGEKAD